MNPEQERIWEYLIENAQGKNHSKNISTIADNIGFPPKGTNNDDVRYWIKEMVVDHGKPIGTCNRGAFIILNDTNEKKLQDLLKEKIVLTLYEETEIIQVNEKIFKRLRQKREGP